MKQIEKYLADIAIRVNWIAAGAIIVMMSLTSADVILRFFRHPIPGTYEIVGLMGAVAASFSLAYTTVMKGHIAVEFLVRKLPRHVQYGIDIITGFAGFLLFAILAWQSALYAMNLKTNSEVSLTLQMPIYPFIFGIAIGCGLLSLVLAANSITALKRITTP
ncbi:MAG: TRAP transporter small permease [Syntrophales bacterium]|jgi:TRAP-type C4-dicarboxylate transport system permease small subunit|nr:TRAP transporter small permease [Syntrophales bacterium]MDY0043395.1 TRAP transporter small permease [Syntrophales bacterium]